MNVLMLLSRSFAHDPRVHREAEALRAAGHTVTLIEWARHSPDAATEEEIRGVRVVRIFNKGLLRWAGTDVARNPLWWREAANRGAWLHRQHPFDVVHCHDLDTLPAGVRLRRRLGIRLVFDAHERFDEMLAGNAPWPIVRAARRLERRLLPSADLVITTGDAIAAHYRKATDARVVVVRNAFGAAPRAYQAPTAETFTVTYIGILSRDRLFPELVPALGAVPGLRFVVGGKREGVHREVMAAALAAPGAEFLGPVPFDDVLPRTLAGHAVVCMLDPKNPQYRTALATKLYDAMATGRPIVTTRGTAMGDFVARHEVGVACDHTPEAVVDAVTALRDDPARCRRLGENGLALARSEYHWSAQATQLVEAYRLLETATIAAAPAGKR